MSTTFRILKAIEYPDSMHAWLFKAYTQNKLTMNPTCGLHDHCFEMVDVHFFDDADAVIFKLMFPKVIFTQAEINISDEEDDGPSAAKSRLWEAKRAIYNSME